jgi:hypothetical protein
MQKASGQLPKIPFMPQSFSPNASRRKISMQTKLQFTSSSIWCKRSYMGHSL